MDWKQEVFKRLDALAEKFGTTGVYLWSVLVRQGYVVGVEDAVFAVISFVFCFIAYKFGRFFIKKAQDDSCDWDEGAFGAFLACCVIGIIAFFVGCMYVYDAIPELLNPQYWALQKIMEVMK